MQLVGATNTYIRMPFICEGLIDGVFGSGIAVLVLAGARARSGRACSKPCRSSTAAGGFLEAARWSASSSWPVRQSEWSRRGFRSDATYARSRATAEFHPADALLALTREGFAYIGSDARVLAWNASAAELTGLSSERVLDHDVRSILIDGAAIVAVPFDGEARTMRVGVNARDGVRWLAAAVVGVNLDSHTHGWLCSFGPERRHREIEQLKNEIVAAVSHELKTPIATIKAYADTLRENSVAVSAARDEYLGIIDEQADRLARAVDDLLLASRVDADQLLHERVTVPLSGLTRPSRRCSSIASSSDSRRPRHEGLRRSRTPSRDLRHLIDNAVKFSSGFDDRRSGHADGNVTIVEVTDRGIGIADEHLP